jgi:hypothetical protein
MNAVRREAAMGSVYRHRELNTRPDGRKTNGGARSGAGRPPFEPTKEQRDVVSILAGLGRPHKEIATLVVNPRTRKPIDDVTLRLRFPEELRQAKAKVSLILGTSLLGKAKAGDNGALGMLARNHWGWDRPGATTMALSVPSANGDIGEEGKIIIEMVRARKRDENGDFIE